MAQSPTIATKTWPAADRGRADAVRLALFVSVSISLHLLFLATGMDFSLISTPPAAPPALAVTFEEPPARPAVEPAARSAPSPAATGAPRAEESAIDVPSSERPEPSAMGQPEAVRADPFLHETPESLVRRHYTPSDEETAGQFGSKLALHFALNPGLRGILGGLKMLNEVLPAEEDIVSLRARCLVVPFVFREHIGTLASGSTIAVWDTRCRAKREPLFQAAGEGRE